MADFKLGLPERIIRASDMDEQSEQLIDDIYEAALVPKLWPATLEKLASTVDAFGAVLFTADRNGVEWWTSSPVAQGVMQAFVSEGWMTRNTRASRQIALKYEGFATDNDLYRDDEIENDPLHVDFLHPRGLGWAAGTVVQVPTGDLLIYNIERRLVDGPYSTATLARLDILRPHLARAGLIAARIGAERALIAAQTLGLLGLPAAVIGAGNGRLRAANTLLQGLMPDVVRERGGRLAFVNLRADTMLGNALARLDHQARTTATLSIPVPATEERCSFVFHLMPVRGMALDLLPGGSLLVVVTPVDRPAVPSAAVIQGLFDLTPAEARVARAIGEGWTLSALAEQTGVKEGTLRGQLKSIFTKTGLKRQSDLVALLNGIALPMRSTRS